MRDIYSNIYHCSMVRWALLSGKRDPDFQRRAKDELKSALAIYQLGILNRNNGKS